MSEQENLSKNYSLGGSPEEVVNNFIIDLQSGKKYCADSAEHWAEIKTFHLPKEMILFNIGVLAFLGAMERQYDVRWVLFCALVFAVISILLSFWFIWEVINENINSVNERQKVMDVALSKILKSGQSFLDITNDYNSGIALSLGKMRGKEKIYNWIQKYSILAFITSILTAIIGMII